MGEGSKSQKIDDIFYERPQSTAVDRSSHRHLRILTFFYLFDKLNLAICYITVLCNAILIEKKIVGLVKL